MVKKLPKFKKSLKSFILDEDAKVIDKTAVKIAITVSFLGVHFLTNIEDANAGSSHANYNEHNNHLKTVEDGLNNPTDNEVVNQFNIKGYTLKADITGKSAGSVHGNHYNHTDGEGGSS